MKRNSLILGLVFSLVLQPVAFAASFPDVAEDHPNYAAIEALDEREIINGYPDGTFGPDKLVNRAEAMKMIVLASGLAVDAEASVKDFPDVKEEDWFYSYVQTAAAKEIVGGYPDGTFKPGDTINLAETLKMVSLALGQEVVAPDGPLYADIDGSEWFASYANFAREKNIIIPDDYGFVHPDQDMTRSAFAEVVYRSLWVKENDGKKFPLSTGWPRYSSAVLPVSFKYDDKNWKLIERADQLVVFRPDKEFVQFSESRQYPNSAAITFEIDENELGLAKLQYMENLRNAFSDAVLTQFKFSGFDAVEMLRAEARIVDWYVFLDDGSVLVVFTEYGDGALGFYLQQHLREMLSSLQYHGLDKVPKLDYSALKSQIFAAILVEGKGKELIESMPDEIIIETDAIGVGTGPVDYYYSQELNMTVKYERASDVILDTRDGQTSAF